jgi:hypothetical protein
MTARLRIWILVLAMACGCAAARQALSGLLEPAAPVITAALRVAPRVAPEPLRTIPPAAAIPVADPATAIVGIRPGCARARDPPAA